MRVKSNHSVLSIRKLSYDGTPLLDIKPYTPSFDKVDDARVPEWSQLIYGSEDYF